MTSAEPLTTEKARQVLESLLFASDQPVPSARLGQVLGKGFDGRSVRSMVDALNEEYAAQSRSFEIVEIAGGFQMLTRPEYKDWIAELHKGRRAEKLSPSAIETLAIVAYRQPIQRAIVDDIRGVQTGPLLRSLLERGLVKVVGRLNVPGRPILYGTTRLFMHHFGLKSLKDLPNVAELTPP
jgi:segregation and condensation protein B